jgi:hypothetical protein
MELHDDNFDEEGLSRAATWFAGYAVVRWHLGYELGDLYLEPDGLGEWLAPHKPIVLPLPPVPDKDDDAPAPYNPDGTLNLEAVKMPEVMVENLMGQLRARQQSEPSPRELVIMDLAARVGEYGERIPRDISAWPAPWLESAMKFFTPAYCQTAFPRPMTYNEAVLFCLAQAKTVLEQHTALHYRLAYELFDRFMRGDLEVSGPEITDLLHHWHDATV